MSEDRLLDQISESLAAIGDNWGIYHQRRLDYRRGSLPTNSMPEHVSSSNEPNVLADCPACQGEGKIKRHATKVKCPDCRGYGCSGQDTTDRQIGENWEHVKAGLTRMRTEARAIEARMAWLVNATKRPADPVPQPCANTGCPDTIIYSMIGKDHPRRSDGRCEACHKWWQRKQYERGVKHYDLGDVHSL